MMTKPELEVLLRERIAASRCAIRRSEEDRRRLKQVRRETERRIDRACRELRAVTALR